jgi:hypothetical protein
VTFRGPSLASIISISRSATRRFRIGQCATRLSALSVFGCMTISSPRPIDRLKPGGLAAFVTSSGTMDKADARAREHIAGMADLIGAIRLPEGSFRADAGTDVVVDILFFRKRRAEEQAGDDSWLDLADAFGGRRGR